MKNTIVEMMEEEKRQKLIYYCRNFIEQHNITSGETIYQQDSVSLSSLEFVEQICDIVGYKEIKDEEDFNSTIGNYFHS